MRCIRTSEIFRRRIFSNSEDFSAATDGNLDRVPSIANLISPEERKNSNFSVDFDEDRAAPSWPCAGPKSILKKTKQGLSNFSIQLRRTRSQPISASRSAHHAPSCSDPFIFSSPHLDPALDHPKASQSFKKARRSFTLGNKPISDGKKMGWADGPRLSGHASPYYLSTTIRTVMPKGSIIVNSSVADESDYYTPPDLDFGVKRARMVAYARIACGFLTTFVLSYCFLIDLLNQALILNQPRFLCFTLGLFLVFIEAVHFAIWRHRRGRINSHSQLTHPTMKRPSATNSKKKLRHPPSCAGGMTISVSSSQTITIRATRRKEMRQRCVRSGTVIPLPSISDSWRSWNRMQREDVTDGLDIQTYISDWFRGQPFESIKRGNIAEFITYAFFYRSLPQMKRLLLRRLIRSMILALEKTFCIRFVPGYNADVSFMGHLKEDLQMGYRPITPFYLVSYTLTLMGRVMLGSMGFSQLSLRSLPDQSNLSPWARRLLNQPSSDHWRVHYYPGTSSEASDSCSIPILFLHGIGIGSLMYTHLLASLVATGHPILSLEHPHVSMNLCLSTPTTDEVAARAINTCSALGFNKVCLFGHSYGCLIASRILKMAPELISSVVMADPVCLG